MLSAIFSAGERSFSFGPDRAYILTGIDGINSYTTTDQREEYPHTDGYTPGEILYGERNIALRGYIRAGSKEELPELRAKLVRFCHGKQKGVLRCRRGAKAYFANALPYGVEFGEPKQNLQTFSVQFALYEFYWREYCEGLYSIYKREDLISGSFTLPCVFTSRTSEATVSNKGDIPIGCRVIVRCAAVGEEQDGESITVENLTTKAVTRITHAMKAGETVIIDGSEYTVTSITDGVETNILQYMTAASTFPSLAIGDNDVKVTCSNTSSEITVELEFYAAFVGVPL